MACVRLAPALRLSLHTRSAQRRLRLRRRLHQAQRLCEIFMEIVKIVQVRRPSPNPLHVLLARLRLRLRLRRPGLLLLLLLIVFDGWPPRDDKGERRRGGGGRRDVKPHAGLRRRHTQARVQLGEGQLNHAAALWGGGPALRPRLRPSQLILLQQRRACPGRPLLRLPLLLLLLQQAQRLQGPRLQPCRRGRQLILLLLPPPALDVQVQLHAQLLASFLTAEHGHCRGAPLGAARAPRRGWHGT
jgi:hypothetical protein